MKEPTIDQIRQEYAKALAMIARMRSDNDCLLAACKRAVRLLEQHQGDALAHSTILQCSAAIAKAEGTA